MTVCDASVVAAWLGREPGADALGLAELLRAQEAAVAPVTITEVLSGPGAPSRTSVAMRGFQILELRAGYWERAGSLRRTLVSNGRKAALGDVLTAQCCLDHNLPLLTRDRDYRAFADLADLRLA